MPTRRDLLDEAIGSAAHRYSPFERLSGSHQNLLGRRQGS
jgi:hypothetical protein